MLCVFIDGFFFFSIFFSLGLCMIVSFGDFCGFAWTRKLISWWWFFLSCRSREAAGSELQLALEAFWLVGGMVNWDMELEV